MLPAVGGQVDRDRVARFERWATRGTAPDEGVFRTRLDRVPVLGTSNEEEAGVGFVLVGVAPIVRYVRLEGTLNIAHC